MDNNELKKLAAIADRVEARGLFNAACDIRDWIQEAHAALARAGTAAPAAAEGPSEPTKLDAGYVLMHSRIAGDLLMEAKQILGGQWNGALDDALNHIDYVRVAVESAPLPTKKGAGEVDAKDAARYRWIEENARTQGGGHGFTITAYVPFDEEDMGVGIDAAIAAQPKDTTDTRRDA